MSLKQWMFFNLCLSITFMISGIMINLIQGFLYFTLGIYFKTLFRKINYYLTYSMQTQMVFLYEWWCDTVMTVYADKEDFHTFFGKEHALVIVNHSYKIDWVIMSCFCDGIKTLGNLKSYAKKSLQYMPILGWSWWFGDYIFLEKSYEKDKVTIKKQIHELGSYPFPMWLMLFPEGMRFSPMRHEKSLKFAKKHGLPLLKYHLTPHTKGFTTSLMVMKGKIDVIYDVTIDFEKNDKFLPIFNNVLSGRPMPVHFHITRIPISEIPENEKAAANWLHDRFVIKDKLRESFHKTGDFFAESGVKRVPSFKMPRRIYSLLHVLFWNILIMVPILKYSFDCLLSGNPLYISLVIAVFSAFYNIRERFNEVAEIDEKSSRGTEKKKEE